MSINLNAPLPELPLSPEQQGELIAACSIAIYSGDPSTEMVLHGMLRLIESLLPTAPPTERPSPEPEPE